MNREDVVNAYAAFSVLHPDKKGDIGDRIYENDTLRDICDVSRCWYPNSETMKRKEVLESLEPDALAGYFGLVDRHFGRERANELLGQWARINRTDGVTIIVENSDDDPTSVAFHVSDPIAGAWADNDRYIDGSTWEESDGDDFIYSYTYWRPGLFDELKAEGYDFDFSNYSEPDEHDISVAVHASECPKCEYDWHKAEKHLKRIEEEPLFNREV